MRVLLVEDDALLGASVRAGLARACTAAPPAAGPAARSAGAGHHRRPARRPAGAAPGRHGVRPSPGQHRHASLLAGSGTDRRTEQRLNASDHFRNTWGASAGYFNTHGSDPTSATRGQLLQLDWTPWGKEDHSAPDPFSAANLRLGVQLWHYNRFGGDSTGATAHDTLHLFAWTAF